MDRRTLLKGMSGLTAGLLMTRKPIAFAQGTPTSGDFSALTITITEDGFTFPDNLTAGRYAVTISNAGKTPSHSSLGRLPDGVTSDQVLAFMKSESNDLPDWFLNAGYVGLPDWPEPGASITGIVDLQAGNYFMFDPFSTRSAFPTVSDGGGSFGPEPEATAVIELKEMQFVLPQNGLPAGPARLKLSNVGAMAHEFQVLPVPAGTTVDQMQALFAMLDNATPPPNDPLAAALSAYQPVAAMSILGEGRTAWLDTDLAAGTYAVLCMLPFPDGVPHAMQGMLEIVTIS